jgi:hypothetical protein
MLFPKWDGCSLGSVVSYVTVWCRYKFINNRVRYPVVGMRGIYLNSILCSRFDKYGIRSDFLKIPV